jgi:hypothetical protein
VSTKTLDKLIGWFVVREDGMPSVRPSEDEEKEAPSERPGPPVVPPGEMHDASSFAEVYRGAGIGEGDQERLERALELVRTLPASTLVEVRRSIVEAAMKAFAVPVDGLLSVAESALGALDRYLAEGDARTKDVLTEARARIERLEREIAEIRRLMELQEQTQRELVGATAKEKARVASLISFFGRE